MRRVVLDALLIIVLFLLQTTVFKWFALAHISPNLLIVLTASCGIIHGRTEGFLVGFFSGILIDIFYGDIFGFYSLIYMLIGYMNGMFNSIFYDIDIKLPIILISISELTYGFVIYVFRFLLRNRLNFGYYFVHVIMPEMLYTIVVTIVLYRLIVALSKFVDGIGKRGDGQIAE